jgi:hypothetical protein
MPSSAKLEVCRVFGERVAVEQGRALAAIAWRAAEQRVLAAFAIARQVSERPIRLGHAGIVLLDAPAHFRDQRLLQRLGRPEHRLGIAVLCLEIGPDVGIEHSGVTQHLLPLLVLEPGIVVRQLDAVKRALERTFARDGRHGGRVLQAH